MDWQRQLAQDSIDAWADLILWHHSHIPWEIEQYKRKWIFYSLWNFVFDQNWGMQVHQPSRFDYFYDHFIGKNRVPTYIGILPYLTLTKDEIIFDKKNILYTTFGVWNTSVAYPYGEFGWLDSESQQYLHSKLYK